MNFTESDLPGIGKKFNIELAGSNSISTIIHLNGVREIYHFDDPDDEPDFHLKLTEDEAQILGTVLLGSFFKPELEQQKELLLNKLSIEWITVDKSSSLSNKSILEMEIRKKTGTTIIAVIRDKDTFINPEPKFVIFPKDTLIITGSREQTKYFHKHFSIDG
jgi:TrkA domain protein